MSTQSTVQQIHQTLDAGVTTLQHSLAWCCVECTDEEHVLDDSLVLCDLFQFAVSFEFVHNMGFDLQQENKDSNVLHHQVISHHYNHIYGYM